jgi:hypothetical protein
MADTRDIIKYSVKAKKGVGSRTRTPIRTDAGATAQLNKVWQGAQGLDLFTKGNNILILLLSVKKVILQ